MLERYRWVVRWRTARFQCRFPRDTITTTYGYYDKRTGLKLDVDSCLSKLRAAKAQITLAKRYIAQQRLRYPLFYDEQAYPDLLRFRQKFARKTASLSECLAAITSSLFCNIDKKPPIRPIKNDYRNDTFT